MYNTKLQGRSRIHRTHNYTWHRRQKQLNPIVTVGNKILRRSVLTKRNSEREKPDLNPYPWATFVGCGSRCERNLYSLMLDIKRLQAEILKQNIEKGTGFSVHSPYNMWAFSFCTCWLDLFYHLFVPHIKMSLFVKNKIVLNQQKRVTEIGIWNASSV